MPSKPVRILEWLGLVAIASAIAMLVAIGVYALYDNSKWDPLGEYPLQVVTQQPAVNLGATPGHTTTPSIAGVEIGGGTAASTISFYLDQDIHSSGIKCVKENEGVIRVRGTLYWQSTQPPGRIIKIADGVGNRGPGCQLYNFSNPVPDAVLEEVGKLTREGFETSNWELTGTEVPVKQDGTEGKSRTWITTTFTLIHEGSP
jgi:hypothetical protein